MKNLARKAKRTRPHNRTFEESEALRNAGHVALGKEAKLLRRLMAQTGLNEEEVRGRECYRKQLADAYKEGCENKAKSSPEARYFKNRILKPILRELKLPKEHPIVIERLKERIKQIEGGVTPGLFMLRWWLKHHGHKGL